MMHFHPTHIIPDPRLHGLYGYLEVIETLRCGLESLGHRVTTAVLHCQASLKSSNQMPPHLSVGCFDAGGESLGIHQR